MQFVDNKPHKNATTVKALHFIWSFLVNIPVHNLMPWSHQPVTNLAKESTTTFNGHSTVIKIMCISTVSCMWRNGRKTILITVKTHHHVYFQGTFGRSWSIMRIKTSDYVTAWKSHRQISIIFRYITLCTGPLEYGLSAVPKAQIVDTICSKGNVR